jgi:Mg-chelatase subunit ChlD
MYCGRLFPAFAGLILAAGAAPAEVADFRLGQAVQASGDSVRAYLDVWDEESNAVATLGTNELSATLGGEAMQIETVLPFRDSGEGIAYVFAVDISRSLSPAHFDGIRRALETWIGRLGPRDRAALVSFGDVSRVVVDFTDDRARLASGLAALGPTDGTTVLFQALRDSIELSSRRDPSLPARRALVVLSDGLDEGSGLTAEDVLVELRERPLPVYAVGFGGPARRESLDLLLRLATNSGGRFVAVEGSDFAAAYEQMREAIERVWVAAMRCSDCRADGAAYRLQVNLQVAGRVLSKGLDVRLLPPVEGVEEATSSVAEVPAEASALPSVADAGVGGGAVSDGRLLGVLAAAGTLTVGVVALVVVRRRRGSKGAQAPVQQRTRRKRLSRRERRLNEVPLGSDPVTAPVAVRFVVVRGAEQGREYRFLLRQSSVLGRGRCDLRLADESGVDSKQMELRPANGGLMARNLSAKRPTLVNGVSLEGSSALKTGDLVGNRDFIARVHLG